MAEKYVIRHAGDKARLIELIQNLAISRPWRFEWCWHREKRTLNQNALMHMWFNEMSKYLIKHGRPFATPEWVKDAMKHTFLGYEDKEQVNVLTGEITVVQQLKHTSGLDTGSMTWFMDQVCAWAMNIGCLLTIPEDSDYSKLKLQEVA